MNQLNFNLRDVLSFCSLCMGQIYNHRHCQNVHYLCVATVFDIKVLVIVIWIYCAIF